MPNRTPTQQDDRKKRKSRREYALPAFDFEECTAPQQGGSDMLAAFGPTKDDKVDKSAELQRRAGRNHGDQMETDKVLLPYGSVSPCMNATDRARRVQRNGIRVPEASTPTAPAPQSGTFCDITPLLRDPSNVKAIVQAPRANAEDSWADDETVDEDEIPDMVLSEDEDDPGKEFEMVRYESMSEHNGTVRRWYRGFRH